MVVLQVKLKRILNMIMEKKFLTVYRTKIESDDSVREYEGEYLRILNDYQVLIFIVDTCENCPRCCFTL